MNDRQLMQQALAALEAETDPAWECNSYHPKIYQIITALRERLAQTEQQEPVGEVLNERGEVDWISFVPPVGTPLYTRPQAREWVGLTDEEVMQTMSGDWTSVFYFARAIEAKLREKNT